MSLTIPPHLNQNIYQNQTKTQKTKNALGDGRQDKRRFYPPRSASRHPAAVAIPQRAEGLNTKTTGVQNVSVHKRKKEKLTLWVDPIDREKLRLKASREGVSLSSAGAGYLRRGMQADLDMEYRALLEPVIASILNRHMAARDNRLALLLVRNYLVSEQNRGLTTYLVGRVPDMTPEVLNDILDTTFQQAKKKLIRRSPELEELIKEVKRWVIDEEQQDGKQRKGKKP